MNTGTRNPRKRSLTPVGDKEYHKAKRASSRSAAKQMVPPPVLTRNRRTSLPGGSGFENSMDQEQNGHFEVVSSREPTNSKSSQSETLNTTTMDRNTGSSSTKPETGAGNTQKDTGAGTPITLETLKMLMSQMLDQQSAQITKTITDKVSQSEQTMSKKINDMDKKFEEEMDNLKDHCDAKIETAVREAEERLRATLPQTQAEQQTSAPIVAGTTKPVTVDTISANVTREMAERKKREKNLIAHGIDEAGPDVKGEAREDHDVDMFKGLLEAMDTGVEITELKKVRRIGRYFPDQTAPRPMLIEFQNVEQRDKVQAKARGLYRRTDDFKNYRLGPDLTEQQRRDDREARDQCEKANAERSQDEKKAFEWKPLGPKGFKKAQKVQIGLDSEGGGPQETQGGNQRVDWRERARKRYGPD